MEMDLGPTGDQYVGYRMSPDHHGPEQGLRYELVPSHGRLPPVEAYLALKMRGPVSRTMSPAR